MMKPRSRAFEKLASLVFVGLAVSAPARESAAFCGFYVAPSDQPLYNDASMVALMRDGTRTVMSMSNNYKGPASDFAMVVPVPVVLHKENVKTLPHDIFGKLEALSAPRLVEYWEQDPCYREQVYPSAAPPMVSMGAGGALPPPMAAPSSYGVTIEAKFTVGEYEILVLSAKESDGLERWLVDNKYSIPKGAAAALAPYIKEQQKFFVAKVNIKKVTMDAQGVAILSPLRFNYESPDFRLPVRLGLLNAQSKQDLIVFVLGKNQRFEVANYKNVFIPTNIDVSNETREAFAPFYATLFDATIAKAGGKAIVTEYAWMSNSCDPCPTPPLDSSDVATLGGDLLYHMASDGPTGGGPPGGINPNGYYGDGSDIVLTRLHTRYDQSTLSDDIVFKTAEAVVGGREFVASDNGTLEKGARPDAENNFQARYAIRHAWTGPINCPNPRRGIWGGPPSGVGGNTSPVPATNLASAPRGTLKLASYVQRGLDDVDAYDLAVADSYKGASVAPVKARACGCQIPGEGTTWTLAGVGTLLAVGLLAARRGRRVRPG